MEEIVEQERILSVLNYGEENGQVVKTRVTISPSCVEFIIAGDEAYTTIEDREIRKVNVMMVSGNNLELFISLLDLTTLERCIGNYYLP